MLSYIVFVKSIEKFCIPHNFGFQAMTGDRAGTFAMTVTKNWRLTFTMIGDGVVANLDLEDYH